MKFPSYLHPNPDPFIRQAYLGRTGLLILLGSYLAQEVLFGFGYFLLRRGLPPSLQQSDSALGYTIRFSTDAVANLAFMLLWIRFALRRPILTVITAGRPVRPMRLLQGALLAACLLLPACVALLLAQSFDTDDWVDIVRDRYDAEAFAFWANFALMILLAAFSEELVFRGFLTQLLGDRVRNRFWLAMIVALSFALSHNLDDGAALFASRFAASMAWSAVTFATGGIEWAVGYHAASNLIITAAEYLLRALPEEDEPQPYLDTLFWAESAMFIVMAGAIFLRLARKPAKPVS